MAIHVPSHADWPALWARITANTPEAFGEGTLRNLFDGQWHDAGKTADQVSPADGRVLSRLLKLDGTTAAGAVREIGRAHV